MIKKSNASFAFSTALKFSMIVLLLGIAISIGKSPVVFGILFLTGAYFTWTWTAALIVGVISFLTSLVSKKQADKEVEIVKANQPTQGDLEAAEVVAAMMKGMKPEEIQDILAAALASQQGKSGKK